MTSEEFNAYKTTDQPSRPSAPNGPCPEGKVSGCLLLFLGGLIGLVFLSWLLLLTVPQVKKFARHKQSSNNMQLLTEVMLEYEFTYDTLPLNDNNGLSWRVHILPFMEHEELYSRFRLDEPWDSPHNIELLDWMPSVYQNPILGGPHDHTVYQVPYTNTATNPALKDRALFDDTGVAVSTKDLPNGSAKTIMLLEVDEAASVEWTKPADWRYDPSAPTRDLGSVRSGEVAVGFADGNCETISKYTTPGQFKAMITRLGGEEVE